MSDVTSRFTIDGTDYDYEADIVRVQWQEDRDDYRRLDNVGEVDYRAQRAIISFETVLVSENSNASGTSAAELFELMRRANEIGQTVTFTPDISASAPHSSTPSVQIVTRGSPPQSYSLEKGGDRLKRSLQVKSKNWLDPNRKSFTITGVDTANENFVVSGDQTGETGLQDGKEFEVNGSTGNDGFYTVSSTSYDSGADETTITVNEDVTDSTADGTIYIDTADIEVIDDLNSLDTTL